MKKIIIIGASSGIGREVARIYAGQGHLVGATGRNKELLASLEKEFPGRILISSFDVQSSENISHLEELIHRMGGMDLLLYNSGYGEPSKKLDWTIDKTTVDTNVNGFIEIINYGFNYFVARGQGHLATTSSIASKRGNDYAPAYSASKAFQSIYFEGLYMKLKKMKLPVYVTDIQPGFVDTEMAKSTKKFWVAPVGKAAEQIVQALEKKKWRVYVTRRWWIIAQVMKWLPNSIYHRLR